MAAQKLRQLGDIAGDPYGIAQAQFNVTNTSVNEEYRS
jgi:hypothetical protein